MDKTTQILARQRCIPMAKLMNMSHAEKLLQALRESQIKAVNISSQIPEGMLLLRYLASQDDIVAGAGNVQTLEQAQVALDNKAAFIFSPRFDPEMILLCQKREIPIYAVATEAEMAIRYGLSVLGCYPVEQLGGLPFIQEMAQQGDFTFIVAGSISEEKMDYYLSSAHVIAMTGAWMFPPKDVEQNNFAAITEALKRVRGYQKAEL